MVPGRGKKIQADGNRTASNPMVDSKVKNTSKLNTVNRLVLVPATENFKWGSKQWDVSP